MRKVLISACLMGEAVRYDGRAAGDGGALLTDWQREGRLVVICPELSGGLPVPRPPAEIRGGNGSDVLAGSARIVTPDGDDVTENFLQGASATLALAQNHGVTVAILKQRSPSCGSREIYDGRFVGNRIAGEGVTAALLRRHGITVFDETQLAEAESWLRHQSD
ncbi:DUF523 domain-containing protein [Dongia soli]|uniref:DUF523 domain-containing protein n=1 Tax=Dongia soli TaxID=600628 RepID=A0ABU5E880_9PROT|nr:DUF523 domain-containing protein [Dongia soli]MDY0882497.1 DUF523 domain-containing protein [Dongia soli]